MSDEVLIEPATLEDLDELSGLLGELFSQEIERCVIGCDG